jgi:hypothetical protein
MSELINNLTPKNRNNNKTKLKKSTPTSVLQSLQLDSPNRPLSKSPQIKRRNQLS